ncbi:hypothetical protein [Mucilaginibacter sp. NFX135]|uniref:hypothetical protein n=1 Tax=Mucilaginibacter sp. NFX135 TaxID=3402687 RepID=UPI003AFA6CB7
MKTLSPLTCKVIAYQILPAFNKDEVVDWAYEMIALGWETDHLLILAGLTKPVNYFEIVSYLKAAINELNLSSKEGVEGIISYSSYYVRQLEQGIKIKENLNALSDFVISVDYHSAICDFYSLYWAWNDLKYDEIQWYWDGATRDNIEQIVINTAKDWLIENESTLNAIFN